MSDWLATLNNKERADVACCAMVVAGFIVCCALIVAGIVACQYLTH